MQSATYSCQDVCKLEFNFLEIYSKNPQIPNVMKNIPWEPSCSMRTNRRTDRQTDRQTEMTKVIVAFRNFAKAPKNGLSQLREVCDECDESSDFTFSENHSYRQTISTVRRIQSLKRYLNKCSSRLSITTTRIYLKIPVMSNICYIFQLYLKPSSCTGIEIYNRAKH
jgi:hypothetical protein